VITRNHTEWVRKIDKLRTANIQHIIFR
jgi:hypothetical protein